MLSGSIISVFYDGLINFYFLRRTGKLFPILSSASRHHLLFLILSSPKGEERYKVRGEKALHRMEKWLAYSEWNFKNKQLLLEAEFHFSMNNHSMAATCYEASIKAAQAHKFRNEEAIANELAGHFFLEVGQREKSLSFFEQSIACYRTWGAFAIESRVEDLIEKEFGISRGIPSELTISLNTW
jgi:tetratricopeptide (TPR) repeat protein